MKPSSLILALVSAAGPALADPPDVVSVEAARTATGWTFDVAIAHPDTGWDHYADGWRVETPSGEVLGTRVLLHPHVNEQPFTRALAGVAIPDGLTEVRIRARCSVDGWSSATFPVAIDQSAAD